MTEKIGRAYRWRVTAVGDVYEYVNRSTYRRRPQLKPKDVDAAPILPRHQFLPVGKGNYVLVHDCVLTTACPHCGARAGERCKGQAFALVYTHWVRRRDARRAQR